MQYPLLRINTGVAKANIKRMATKAKALNIEFRPHFKTHQSLEIGNWFREFGVNGITVSSLTMAEFFAENGWDDITVAFPVSVLDIRRINKLAKKIDLNILASDSDTIQFLDTKLETNLSIYIEIDPNYGRSGVSINKSDSIEIIHQVIQKSEYINFEGFYAHAGHTYKRSTQEEVTSLTRPLIEELSKLKNTFGGKLCWGDTPSCSNLDTFGNVDQLSPGNFVFYDWMQTRIGSCSPDQIAVKMECPVVAKFDDRKELLIHGGAVHFSKEFVINADGTQNFGQVLNPTHDNDYSNYVKSISQEHGIITCTDSFFNSIAVGEVIEIYPIHSCLTANLMQAYVTESKEVLKQFASGAPFKG